MAERRPRERGFSRRPKILDYVGAGSMDEEDARHLAYEVVREARGYGYHSPEAPAPDLEAVRARREARTRSEE